MRTVVALLCIIAVAYAAELLASDSPTAVAGSYIVVMREGITSAARDAHLTALLATATAVTDAEVLYKYDMTSFIGFAAKLSPKMLADELGHDDVAYIEADQTVQASAYITQSGATWGLARIDQPTLTSKTTYSYNSTAGSGADVYVIDTGLYTANVDFGTRGVAAFNAYPAEPNTDNNGHGTHCAGTIGGTTYGVAKQVKLFGVRVLNAAGSGTNAGVISGVNFVSGEKKKNPARPAVASMSLGGGASTALDQAVASSIADGITYVIAAGNDNANACNYSPARVSTAITVGATDSTDTRASYSNYGTCVDIFAPGSLITSDWIGSTTATKTISGTSMATPHVSGVVALHLAQYPNLKPADVKTWLLTAKIGGSIHNVVKNPGTGSPNVFLYSHYA